MFVFYAVIRLQKNFIVQHVLSAKVYFGKLQGGEVNMLSLGRNPGEYVVIGNDIVVEVVSVGGMLRLAIDAPKDVKIIRGEIYEKDHPAPEAVARTREKYKTK